MTFGDSHELATRVEILAGNRSPDATPLDIVSGAVTYDRRAAIRRRMNLTIAGHDLVPTSDASLLAPYGNTIAVWRGYKAPSRDLSPDNLPNRLGDDLIVHAPLGDTDPFINHGSGDNLAGYAGSGFDAVAGPRPNTFATRLDGYHDAADDLLRAHNAAVSTSYTLAFAVRYADIRGDSGWGSRTLSAIGGKGWSLYFSGNYSAGERLIFRNNNSGPGYLNYLVMTEADGMPANGQWFHAALIVDDGTVRGYLDGVETFEQTGLTVSNPEWFQAFSLWTSGDTELVLDMADMVVAGRALTANEIAQLAKSTLTGVATTTVTEPLGTYRIETVDVTEDGLQVTGLDRSARVAESKLLEPVTIHAGLPIGHVVRALITPVDPTAALLDRSPPGFVTAAAVLPVGTGRLDAIHEITRAAGLALYVDRHNRYILEPERTLSPSASAAEFSEGAGGTLVSARKRWTRGDTHNAVLAIGTGNSDTPPPSALAVIDDGPFRYAGKFGRREKIYRSEHIANTAQAASAAAAVLDGQQGAEQTVTFGAIPDPRRDVGETVTIWRPRLGIAEPHLLETLHIPLDLSSPMTGTTRTSLMPAAIGDDHQAYEPGSPASDITWAGITAAGTWADITAHHDWATLHGADLT